MRRAWSLLTVDGAREYGGNTGYDDRPTSHYRYDSDVANHLQVSEGDIVLVRSRTTVIGIAEIEKIQTSPGFKDRLRCPLCNITNIKQRATMVPAWVCHNGHKFETPAKEQVPVTVYEARYGGTFRDCSGLLSVSALQDAVIRPSDQMSIKEIDLARIERALPADDKMEEIIKRFSAHLPVPENLGSEDDSRPPSMIDQRRRVLREISLRRGQAKFRERLMKRYGARCQISGCSFPGLLEAAHISPYATSMNNEVGNGLLLRSDLHTLFDLGCIGIDPATLKVHFHTATLSEGYGQYEGVNLMLNHTAGPKSGALLERWRFFRSLTPS